MRRALSFDRAVFAPFSAILPAGSLGLLRPMRYDAHLTAGALKVAESRVIADLLLQGLDASQMKQKILIENVLQARRPKTALRLALLFRVLAPMRSRMAMVAVAEGIEAMARQEAAYWLGMAVHRKNPRRVLTALRILLTAPAR